MSATIPNARLSIIKRMLPLHSHQVLSIFSLSLAFNKQLQKFQLPIQPLQALRLSLRSVTAQATAYGLFIQK